MQIHQVGMTRAHYQAGEADRIRMIVLHATAGRYPGDYGWLRQGGSSAAPVSIHYYIDKKGTISQMVADHDIAWHAGRSTWRIDGEEINYNVGCNPISLGIELENLNNGSDVYPEAQYTAALWLTRQLVERYGVPRDLLVRHLDIAPGRKTDPRAFAWERFVNDVYAESHGSEKTAVLPVPGIEPPPEAEQPERSRPLMPDDIRVLRGRLLDLAYCAAATSCPQDWPLLHEAVSQRTGMPVLALTAEHNEERPIRLAGRELVAEAYGRDLFYAPPDQLTAITTLSSTPEGPLRDALLEALFRAVDPASGYRPDWRFHQYYLEHQPDLGVPIGPNYRLAGTTRDGQQYACQHFSLDTLCSPVGRWGTLIRLSELTRGMYNDDPHEPEERDLRRLLLDDLYQRRTGHTFDPDALFCQYALTHNLGAPLGKAEYLNVGGRQLVALPYALDVLCCAVPADGNWRDTTVHTLPDTLGAEEAVQQPTPARLSALLHQEQPDVPGPGEPWLPVARGALLGHEHEPPPIIDLTLHTSSEHLSRLAAPDFLVVCSTKGPASRDFATAAEAPAWHYYLTRSGSIIHLLDEHYSVQSSSRWTWHDQAGLEQRALVLAVEGGTQAMPRAQHRALMRLLSDLMRRHHLKRERLLTLPAAPGEGTARSAVQTVVEPEPAALSAHAYAAAGGG